MKMIMKTTFNKILNISLVLIALIVFGGTAWGADATLTITRDDVTDANDYGTDSEWTVGTISGKCQIYGTTTASLQFNGSKPTGTEGTGTGEVIKSRRCWNTTAMPGKIKSITITTASGTERAWRVFCGTSAATSSSGTDYGTEFGSSATATTSGTSWNVPSNDNTNYTYFMAYSNTTSASYIASIVVTYESGPSTYTVTVNSNNTNYGTVSQASVTNVANNTSISASSNVLTVGSTTITATPADQDADYNYSFSSWSNVPASGKVTADVTVTATFTRTERALTNYRTICCTPLGSVSGTVSCTSGTAATLSWTAVDGASSYKVKVPGSTSHDDWMTATSGVSVTGLTAGQNYTAYFQAFSTDGTHCTESAESTTAFTTPQIMVTGTPNAMSYAEGEGPSSTESFVVKGKGLCGNNSGQLTVTAPTNFEVSLDESSWGDSKTITKANAESNSGQTVYVRLKKDLLLANSPFGPSNVVISGGNAASVNVSVSGTVTSACSAPTVTTPTCTSVADGSITVSCASITVDANCDVDEYGFVWKAGSAPTIDDHKNAIDGDYADNFSKALTIADFATGTTYYIKAFGHNAANYALSDALMVTPRKVTFNKNGHGSQDAPATQYMVDGGKASEPSALSDDNYTFGGWYDNTDWTQGNAWDFENDVVSDGDQVLYAKWTPKTYSITVSGLTNVAPTVDFPAEFVYTGETTTALNRTLAVNTTNFFLPDNLTVTMGGSTLTQGTQYTYSNSTGVFAFNAVITGDIVISGTAVAKLKSIAITAQPTTRKYLVGDVFSSTGATVTATMGDGNTKTVSATWTPNTALSAGEGQTITATYTERDIVQTATTSVDVYSVEVKTVDEANDNEIDVKDVEASCSVAALSHNTGSTNYKFKEWHLQTASGMSISNNALTGTPTGDVVVYARFYKPVTVTWLNNRKPVAAGLQTTSVEYGTQWKDLTLPATPSAPTACSEKTFKGWTNMSEDWSGDTHDAAPTICLTSFSGVTTAINEPITFKAVFATQEDGYEEEDQDPYSYTITKKEWSEEGAKTLSGKSWTLSHSDTEYDTNYNYDGTKGQQVGKAADPVSTMSLSTSDFSGKIKAVKITTSGAASVIATVGVSVGSTAFKNSGNETVSISATSTEYTFTGSASGTITISWDNSSAKALYFKAISVEYATLTPTTITKDYVTECCSALDDINGGVSWSNPTTAVLTWDAIEHVSSWAVKFKKHVDGSYSDFEGAITGTENKTCTISGLTPCANYDFQIIATPADGYCDKSQTINDESAHAYAVTFPTLTGTTKKSGDPTSCAADNYVATFEAESAAYELPTSTGVTVTIGGTPTTDYTWVVSEGVGTLTVLKASIIGNIAISIVSVAHTCTATPLLDDASVSGTFNLSTIGVSCTGITPGTYCEVESGKYGFIWYAGTGDKVIDEEGVTKVAISTGNYTSGAFATELSGPFAVGSIYTFRAFAENTGDKVGYSDAESFTPRSVTFNKNNGEDNDVVYVNSGSVVAQPGAPSKDGYTFSKWQLGESEYTFSDAVNSNITLDAVYNVNSYSLSWDKNAEDADDLSGTYDSGDTEYGAEIAAPTDPTRTGYNFTGWNSAANGTGDPYTGTMPAENVTYYAQWSIATYSVKWSVNGDDTYVEGEPSTSATYNTKVAKLPKNPTSSDCDEAKVFVGWRATEIEGTSTTAPSGIFTTVAKSPEVTGDVTFYAVFADVTVGQSITLSFPDDNSAENGQKNYTSTWTAIKGNYSWSIENFNNNNWEDNWAHIKCGRKNNTSTGKITTSNAIGFVVDTVIVNVGSITANNVNSAKLYISSASTFATKTSMDIDQSTGEKKLVMASPAEDMYYQIEYDCASASSNGVVQINSITFKQKTDTANYVTSCASCDVDATFTNTTPEVSEIGCTTATLTMEGGLATLGGEGCNVSDYGFVIGTEDNPAIGGEGVTKLQVGTTNPTTEADFSYDATELTKGIHYYIRAYAKNGHGIAYSSSQNFWTKNVSSIAITNEPSKTNYIAGETFDATGMEVTATLASGSTEIVTGDVTYSGSSLTAGESQNFTINYALCETEVATNQAINVYTLTVTEGTNPSYGTASGSANIVSITGLSSNKTYTLTVTSSNATAVDNGDNTWSITNPSGDVAVRVDYIDAVQVKVYYQVNGVTVTGLTQDVYQSAKTTLPTASALATAMSAQSMSVPDATLPNFYGWSESAFGEQTAEPTIVTGTPTINAEKTFYAVFTNVNKIRIDESNITSQSYPSSATSVTIGGKTFPYHMILKNGANLQFKKDDIKYGYIYNSSELSYITHVDIGGSSSQDNIDVFACSEAGTVTGTALVDANTREDAYVYNMPANTSYFMVKGDNIYTYYIDYIDIYYASEAARFATDFRTLTFVKLDNTSSATTMAKNHVYTIVEADAPSADGYIFHNWSGSDGETYNVNDDVTLIDNLTLKPNVEIIGNVILPDGLGDVTVNDGKAIAVSADRSLDNLTVEAGGTVSVAANMELTVNNITIESQAGKSGQLIQAEGASATVNGNIYLDIKFYSGDALDETSANQWYMISAPFAVNVNGGFFQTDGTPMTFGQDFDLFLYDGNKRANTGVTGWTRINGQMPAGKACLIGFNAGQPTTIRLKAASNEISDPDEIELGTFEPEGYIAGSQNWNGVANPRLCYTDLAYDQDMFIWNNEEGENGRKYITYSAEDYSFVVGTPFFVQATGSIELSDATHSTPEELRAPKRSSNAQRYSYRVQITREGANVFADQMYVRASEEAKAEYEQGHDMITWNGTSDKTALIWSNNYGMRLAVEEAPMVNGKATYELGIFAPSAGTYTISVAAPKENATLYLTKNGRIYWNLTMGACELDLNQGQNNEYGLILRAEAPAVTTGVEQVTVSGERLEVSGAQKVIIDEHVYILRGEQLYGIDGKAVK